MCLLAGQTPRYTTFWEQTWDKPFLTFQEVWEMCLHGKDILKGKYYSWED